MLSSFAGTFGQAFTTSIEAGIAHKDKPPDDFFSEVLDLLNSD